LKPDSREASLVSRKRKLKKSLEEAEKSF